LSLDIEYKFVNNSRYAETNYIYSIHCAKEFIQDEDILLLHGDLVFEDTVIETIINSEKSCMVVSSTKELPQKDFKAVLDNGKITSVGIEFFDNAITAQPMYYIKKEDWNVWLSKIGEYCESGNTNCYAENAFNEVSDKCNIYPYDVKNMLCQEIDTEEDLNIVVNKINEIKNRTVYMCFSTDIVHSGHIAIIKKAAKLGKLTVGVLSDEAVISFKRFPLLPFEERKVLFENISDVYSVIKQDTLSYANVINELKPDFIVHGDDWNTGFQKPIRDEVVKLISAYGGQLVEFPYTNDIKFNLLEKRAIEELLVLVYNYGHGKLNIL
jgi:phosphoenolpyruvate phosphomutase